jgi:hypothetical protein
MAHFAKVENNIVTDVIVAEQSFINTLRDKDQWVQTSYNTYGGKHTLGGQPLRKNYAGIGFKYDAMLDAFIPPQTYPSWRLDESSCLWNAPVEHPQDDNEYEWDEETKNWKLYKEEIE